jgi:hypothetical protein
MGGAAVDATLNGFDQNDAAAHHWNVEPTEQRSHAVQAARMARARDSTTGSTWRLASG